MVNHPSSWHIRLLSLALVITATCTIPAHAFASMGRQQNQASFSSILRYRASDDSSSSSYTDSLWQAALHPAHDLSSSYASKATLNLHHQQGNNVSNAFPLELRPISIESSTTNNDSHTSSSYSDDLIETAKAFAPVAIEFGVVAAVAGNAQYLFNGWQWGMEKRAGCRWSPSCSPNCSVAHLRQGHSREKMSMVRWHRDNLE